MSKEAMIIHENGDYWVLDTRDSFAVMRAGITHSKGESAYPRTPDGRSIAIARCNYLAKREGARR